MKLRLMDMPMMNVRPVHVGVLYRVVRVEMVVLPGRFPVVRVLVVLVVFVLVGMGEAFVLVEVPVHFAVEEEHAGKHDQCRHPVLPRGALPKDQDGKDGADERTRCEPGAGSGRADCPEGVNEKDQARPVAECPYGERSRDLQGRDLAFEKDKGEQHVEDPGAPTLQASEERGRQGFQFTRQVVVDAPENTGRQHGESGDRQLQLAAAAKKYQNRSADDGELSNPHPKPDLLMKDHPGKQSGGDSLEVEQQRHLGCRS